MTVVLLQLFKLDLLPKDMHSSIWFDGRGCFQMMSCMKYLFIAFLTGSFFPLEASALERELAERREYPYTANLPACEDQAVTSLVASRFAGREADYWKTGLRIDLIDHIKTVGFRPNGPDLIPRRYCTATVVTSDQRKRRMDYIIVEDAGIIGWSYGVDWCISGLDRNYAYDGRCRAARP